MLGKLVSITLLCEDISAIFVSLWFFKGTEQVALSTRLTYPLLAGCKLTQITLKQDWYKD